MDKPQETFDFSKPEDQKKFDQLPEDQKKEFIDNQMPRAAEEDKERTSVDDIITSDQGSASFKREQILGKMNGHGSYDLDYKFEGEESANGFSGTNKRETICGTIDGISFSVSKFIETKSYEGIVKDKKIDVNDAMAIFEKYLEIAKLASEEKRIAKKAADNIDVDIAVKNLLK